jgi:hypothetical protein
VRIKSTDNTVFYFSLDDADGVGEEFIPVSE